MRTRKRGDNFYFVKTAVVRAVSFLLPVGGRRPNCSFSFATGILPALLLLLVVVIKMNSVLFGAAIGEGVGYSSVGSFSFYGGQYFFSGAPGALSGNLNFNISPTIKFSNKAASILTLDISYRGSKEVTDIAGGGALFQDAASGGAIFKFVISPIKSLTLRPAASYRKELLRETKDENWTKGLFDYDKVSGGIETEYRFAKDNSVALGYDYFTITFPNYVSLESKSGSLGREQQGSRTLDSANNMLTITSRNRFFNRRFLLDASLIKNDKNYPEQPLAVSLDALSPTEKRADTSFLASLSAGYIFAAGKNFLIAPSAGFSYISLDSNQNRVDATKSVFVKDYYDYTNLIPSANLAFIFNTLNNNANGASDSQSTVFVRWSGGAKNYPSRPVQDVSGNYGTEKIYINETIYTLGLSYPLSRQTKVSVTGSYLKSESNMKYESVYRYNYESATYFLGIKYDF